MLRATNGYPGEGTDLSSSSSSEQAPCRLLHQITSFDSGDPPDESSKSSGDAPFGSNFFDAELCIVLTQGFDRTKEHKKSKHKLKYQQAFLKEDSPSTYLPQRDLIENDAISGATGRNTPI